MAAAQDPWSPGADGWTPFEDVAQIPSRFVYIRNDTTGRHVGAEPSGQHIRMHEHTGDDCMWLLEEEPEEGGGLLLRSAVTDMVLRAAPAAPIAPSYGERGVALSIEDVRELFQTAAADPEGQEKARPMGMGMARQSKVQDPEDELGEGVFTALRGPNRLPSEYVAEMEATGYAILDNIYRPDDIREIKQMHEQMVGDGSAMPEEGRAGLDSNAVLCNCPVLSKGSFHPVSMWVIQHYLGVPELHMSHVPSYTITKPATTQRGKLGRGGWHADYPYRPGRFLDDIYPEAPRFGVQYNVCVDEFTPQNGATQFVRGSHHSGSDPPMEMQMAEVTAGVTGTMFEDVHQVTAPAGAAFIYDARLWHRACPELNHTESWRVAILNCVLPRWITPMLPREQGAEMFMSSHAREVLSPREVRDVEAMCCMLPRYEGPNSATNYTRKARKLGWDAKLEPEQALTRPKQLPDESAANAASFNRGQQAGAAAKKAKEEEQQQQAAQAASKL
jgi:hypothetical protein